jgi:hypothetical protein
MNAIVKTNTGTAVAVRRDNSPIVSDGRIGKAIAVATNDLIETYRTPNMTPEQAGATMRSYVRVMEGHSEAVVARALNELIVSNPAGRWLPSPTDLRDAIDQIENARLHEFWRKLNLRLNMVAADIREALREELFTVLRAVAEEHGATDADWAALVALGTTGRAVDGNGVLIQAHAWADRWRPIIHAWADRWRPIIYARLADEALAAAIEAVRPGIEAKFARGEIEAPGWFGADYIGNWAPSILAARTDLPQTPLGAAILEAAVAAMPERYRPRLCSGDF